jgi:type II secretion system protein N
MSGSALKQLQRWWLLPIMVMLFLTVGLWLFFPAQAVQQRLQYELTAQLQRPVSVGDVALQLPLTLAISSLDTTVTPDLPVQLTDLTLRPVWLRLLSTTPAITFGAKTLGGQLHVELDCANHLRFSAQNLLLDVPLTSAPQLAMLHVQVTIEQLQGTAIMAPHNQLQQLRLKFSELRISGLQQAGLSVDCLNLGTVVLQLSQDEQCLTIEQLTSHDGDLIINGSGSIAVNRALWRSRLNLILDMTPAESFDQTLSRLLPLFAKANKDGRFTLHIGGTPVAPRMR